MLLLLHQLTPALIVSNTADGRNAYAFRRNAKVVNMVGVQHVSKKHEGRNLPFVPMAEQRDRLISRPKWADLKWRDLKNVGS